jgi:hypothetical protein
MNDIVEGNPLTDIEALRRNRGKLVIKDGVVNRNTLAE